MKNWKKWIGNIGNCMGFNEESAQVPTDKAEVSQGQQKQVPFNLQSIRDEMVSNFRNQLEDNSFDDTVLFPMVCTVILNTKDFHKRREYFYELGANAVNQFYQVIRSAAEGGGKHCKHMATYWTIEFVECLDGESVEYGQDTIKVDAGKTITLFSVFDKLGDIKDGNDAGISYSVKYSGCDDFRNLNINQEMLANINIISDTRFHYPWSERMATGSTAAKQQSGQKVRKQPLASFTYMEDFESRTYMMYDAQCRISGLDETGREDHICRLATSGVKAGHLNIQYLPYERKFKVMATGETMLNGMPLALSNGTDVVWVDLPDQSEIVLGRSVILKFNKLVG